MGKKAPIKNVYLGQALLLTGLWSVYPIIFFLGAFYVVIYMIIIEKILIQSFRDKCKKGRKISIILLLIMYVIILGISLQVIWWGEPGRGGALSMEYFLMLPLIIPLIVISPFWNLRLMHRYPKS